MRRITVAATLAAVLTAAAPALGQTTDSREPARLSVTGQGTVDRAPDQAIVSLGIVTNDENAARASSDNNAAFERLTTRLRALGIAASAIRTTSYDISYNPRPQQVDPHIAQRFGYVVNRGVSVTTARTDAAGAIVDAAVGAGVAEVRGVAFGLRDQRAAYREALSAAVADAAAQASALAGAAHLRVVRIARIGEAGFEGVPRPVPQFARVASSVGVPTEITASSLSVTATVTVLYDVAQ